MADSDLWGFSLWPHQQHDSLDPFGMFDACWRVQQVWLSQPQELFHQFCELGSGLAALQVQASRRLSGSDSRDLIPAVRYDERFQGPIWEKNLYFDHLKEVYLLYTHWLEDAIYATPEVTEQEKLKAGFQIRQMLNAVAPSNFFLSNPAALQRCLETGRFSLWEGAANMIKDMRHG